MTNNTGFLIIKFMEFKIDKDFKNIHMMRINRL